MSGSDSRVAEYSLRKVQRLHAMLMSDKPNIEAVRKHNLEDTALEYLDVFFSIAVGADDADEAAQGQARDLVGLMGVHAHPREMLLAIGEQVEKAVEDLDAVEPEEMPDDEEEDAGAPSVARASTAASGTGRLTARLALVLETYTAVIPRLSVKAANKTLAEMVSGLSDLLDDLLEARMFGVELQAEEMRRVLRAMGGMVRAASAWSADKTGSEEIRTTLSRLFCKTLILAQDKLEVPFLGVWFSELHPERIPSTKGKAKIGSDQAETMEVVVATLFALGFDTPSLLSLVSKPTVSLDNPHLPFSALLAIAYLSISGSASKLPLDDPLDALRACMPLLGSALNGLCVQAGTTWAAELVRRAVEDGAAHTPERTIRLDDGTASLLIELIMPNMAGDPSELSRFAQHRLLAGVIAVTARPAQAGLYAQILSPGNPFENVRVSALALLREEVARGLADGAADGALGPDMEALVKTQVLVIPEADPPLLDSSAAEIAETAWPAWLAEAANLLYLLLKAHSDPLLLNSEAERKGTHERFLAPLGAVVQRWTSEADAVPDAHDRMKLQATLFGLGETIARIEALGASTP